VRLQRHSRLLQTAHLMNDLSLLVSDSTSLVHIESAHLQAGKSHDQT